MGLKAQADVITAVIIILLAAALTTSAFLWGMPLVQKRQEIATVEKASSYFDRDNSNSLVKKIEYIAKNGGEDTFTSEINGIWEFYSYDFQGPQNNSIEFMFRSKATNIAPDMGWIPFKTSSLNSSGYVGLDEQSVVLAKAETSKDVFLIRYKIWFRKLISTDGKIYEIRLVPRNPSLPNASTGNTIRISREGVPQPDPNNNNLIITKIQILLG
jgi:hypothetical protein